ncbi:hypothetical protein GCM10017691_33320 [Pseudonocardia petroleophila]|uniref:hypothetical protein n=1 Tax=Pseudonocardia petroleophila TaxID=37331 RepID=UPI0031DE0BA6
MSTIHDVLRELLQMPGATYSCAAVRASGDVVAEAGAEPVDPAAVVRWARTAADLLADADDDLEDLMVTSRRSYRIVRPVDGGERGPLLLLLCLDRSRATLAAARRELALVRLVDAPPAPSALPPGVIEVPPPSQALAAPPAPLPRRVPAAIPPPAVRIPSTRAPRWPSRARPPGSVAVAPPPAAPSVVPQPRRGAPVPGPRPEPTAAPAPRWADDVGTLRRLLAGLRAL